MSFKDSVMRVGKRGLIMTNLMLMKESTGSLYLQELVPEVKEEGWFDDFMDALVAYSKDSTLTQEMRDKAIVYHAYAQTVDTR
jgi:hypothetical protein